MESVFLGCDPGIKGGVASIKQNNCIVIDMPHLIKELYFFLKSEKEYSIQHGLDIFCILESSQVLPKQGIKGAFTYGIGYGKIKAVLEILDIPFQEIHPAKWKKEYSLINKGKDASVKAAQQLFPAIEFFTPRGRMLDGRAESILMADYGRRIYVKTKG